MDDLSTIRSEALAAVAAASDARALDAARVAAQRRGLANVRFEQASIYELPFPDGSFDAVLAHTLLIHLREPLAALRVLRRMLRPGGVACISDDDWDTHLVSPTDPLVERGWALWTRLLEHNGASPRYSRHLRGLMLEAGFARVEDISASTIPPDFARNPRIHRTWRLVRIDPARM